jgi:hypothetical protein
MRRGSILVLMLGIVLIMSALAVSFLHVVKEEITYIGQIDPAVDFRVKNDSALSIAITSLYSYMSKDYSLDECRKNIERCMGDNLGSDVTFLLTPEDNKVPLRSEFLALLEQLFFAIELDYPEVRSLMSDLKELFELKKQGPSNVEHLLALPAFKRVFVKKNGFFTKKWQTFTKNVTCLETDTIALHELNDELLQAICSMEDWRFDDAKIALQSAPASSGNFQNNAFTELYFHGCVVRDPGLFKGKNTYFNLAITVKTDDVTLTKNYTITYNPFHNWYGFPFEVVF